MSRRTSRVADMVRAELGELIRRELRDPRVGLVTISEVDLSPDLSHARVRVSTLGEDEARELSLDTLNRASGFLRTQLANRLNLRATPALRFELDRGAETSRQITDLLEGLDHDREDA